MTDSPTGSSSSPNAASSDLSKLPGDSLLSSSTSAAPGSSTNHQGALVSPDSQNNNRPNHDRPCVVSPEKSIAVIRRKTTTEIDVSGDGEGLVIDVDGEPMNFGGRILYSRDGAAYIIEEGVEKTTTPGDWSTEKVDDYPLVSAVHLRATDPLVQRYEICDSTDNESIIGGNTRGRILICFLCKLSFPGASSFESHAVVKHQVALSAEDRRLLVVGGASAIVQKGPAVSLLKPVEEEKEMTEIKVTYRFWKTGRI